MSQTKQISNSLKNHPEYDSDEDCDLEQDPINIALYQNTKANPKKRDHNQMELESVTKDNTAYQSSTKRQHISLNINNAVTEGINIDTEQILSLSDDDEDAENESKQDYKTLLTAKQFEVLNKNGYCEMLNDETDNKLLVNLITGYIRTNHNGDGIIMEIINCIVYFHGAKFDIDQYVQLKSGGQIPRYFLTAKINIQLSNLLNNQHSDTLEVTQVPPDTLDLVIKYLAHHKGIEPVKISCPVRSIHMQQIVADKWDATYIDSCDKKTIFEIILAANYMDIKSLVHLGSAKIATMIKQLDQREINRIIEEEETYRREQSEKRANESRFGLNEQDDNDNHDNENNSNPIKD